jgi:DNA-binding XRE family transcriptional regulator
MLTKKRKNIGATYDNLPEAVKPAILALSVLANRISGLPPRDRDDLFSLFQAWRDTKDPEELQGIRAAMEEILAQAPISVRPLALEEARKVPERNRAWAKHVGSKIRDMRERMGLNQSELAEKARLTQSHVSRLENAEHTATSFTLRKIADALGVSVGEIDPCAD